MNRKFTFVALLGALILFASCTKDVNGEGSIGLDTSVVARQIFGEGLSRQISGLDTNELEKSLMEFVNQNFKINFKLTLSGDFEGSDTQPVSAWNFLWADMTDSQADDSYILRIKSIPIGSSINAKVEASFDITSAYEEKIESLINEYFAKLSSSNAQISSNIKYQLLNRFSAEQYKDVKFEGSTSSPIIVHAGKNTATIELEQTSGFKMNGGFTFELEGNDSLGLLVENDSEGEYIKIKPADSNYMFVRVEYNKYPDNDQVIFDSNHSTGNVYNDEYSFVLSESELLITGNNSSATSLFGDEGVILYIIAKNKNTGTYKTTIYQGL